MQKSKLFITSTNSQNLFS
uniref:Uncharacterized protein n=1 Tax=Rhizophora mucronata TaxID=61149 RepID=A0A2P2NY80_RHIMU